MGKMFAESYALKEIHCPHDAVANGSHGLMVWSMYARMKGNNPRLLSRSHFSKLMVSVMFLCVHVWLPSVQHGTPTVQFASPGTVTFTRFWNTVQMWNFKFGSLICLQTEHLLVKKKWTSISGMFANILSPYRDFLLFAPYLDQALVSSTGIPSGYVTNDRAVKLETKSRREKELTAEILFRFNLCRRQFRSHAKWDLLCFTRNTSNISEWSFKQDGFDFIW